MYKPILNAVGIVAVMASVFTGCAPTLVTTSMETSMRSGIKEDGTFHGQQMTPAIDGVSVVAELAVTEKKIMGQAWGFISNKAEVEKAAVLDALYRDPAGPNSADVLVVPNFFYRYDMGSDKLMVTVSGYPARYKNFRPGHERDDVNGGVEETRDANQAPAPLAQPVYQTPAVPAQPAYQTPVIPAQPTHQTPAPLNILPRAPAQATQQSPVTNTPKE